MSFEKSGLDSLVKFGTNTQASLVYFSIPVVAKHMGSLGAQTVDGRQSLASLVYFITNTYQLALTIEFRKTSGLFCSYSLVQIHSLCSCIFPFWS